MEKVMSLLVTIATDYGDIAFDVGDGKPTPPRVAPVGTCSSNHLYAA